MKDRHYSVCDRLWLTVTSTDLFEINLYFNSTLIALEHGSLGCLGNLMRRSWWN
jgi:hypothetical protein